jgi:hypothetical protein
MLQPNATSPAKVDMVPDFKTGDTLSITKDVSLPWAAGNGAGGLDTGSLVVGTHVWCFLIQNGAALDLLFSYSQTPVLPSGWSIVKPRGAVPIVANASGAPVVAGFIQDGSRFMYTAGYQVLAADGGPVQGPNNPQFLRNLAGLPIGRKVTAIFMANTQGPNESYFMFWDPDRGYPNAADWRYASGRRVAGGEIWNDLQVGVNATAQMWTGDQIAGSILVMVIHGWIDEVAIR